MKAFLLVAVAFVVVGCGSSQCVQPSPFEPIAHCGENDVHDNCLWQVE